jgi:hypothetical protein
MNAHAHRPFVRRQPQHSPLERLATWVNTKWEARRARRLEEETVVYLSAMDTKLLNDIGMDVETLADLTSKPSTAETAKIVQLPRPSRRRTRS